MIDYAALDKISERLIAYRGEGNGNVLFDARDKNNYHVNTIVRETYPMLKKADPTGLAMGMLLNEMIETTIGLSKVTLENVLRKEGFLAELREVLSIKADLDEMVLAPTLQFQDQVQRLIANVSPDFGRPSTRELACCLRDAIHSMENGLTLRWVRFDDDGSNAPVGLHDKVIECKSIAAFIDLLKTSLPYGAFLAKIGSVQTAIGIKKPGRIAYLSRLNIDTYTGQVVQNAITDEHMRDLFDLNSPAPRFPKWRNRGFKNDAYYDAGDAGFESTADIERDVLIWLAMVIELAGRKMAEVQPGLIRLAETVVTATADAEQVAKLPALLRPNWTLHKPSLDEMMTNLGFDHPWMAEFFKEAMVGLTADTFLPIGEVKVGFCPKEKNYVRWPADRDKEYDYNQAAAITKSRYGFISVSNGLAGTEQEVYEAIRTIFARNLASYLLPWGSEKFKKLWEEHLPWFEKRLRNNLARAIEHPSTRVFSTYESANRGQYIKAIYVQSPKRASFTPLCIFDGRSQVNAVARIQPMNAEELRQVLGLKSVNYLPDFLKLWERDLGWSTGLESQYDAPYMINKRWPFAVKPNHAKGNPMLSMLICFNTLNHRTDKKLED